MRRSVTKKQDYLSRTPPETVFLNRPPQPFINGFGFVAAAWIVGFMAERQQVRSVTDSIPAFLAGSVVIYLIGATVLAYQLGIPFAADLDEPSALKFGIAPFVIGDVLKAVVAGLLVPGAWKIFDPFGE